VVTNACASKEGLVASDHAFPLRIDVRNYSIALERGDSASRFARFERKVIVVGVCTVDGCRRFNPPESMMLLGKNESAPK
jgi:hypothetical protein